MSNTPSDDGLFELIKEHFDLDKRPFDTVIDRKTGRFHDAARYRDFASAVLARWGTPQPVVREPLTAEQVDALIATKHFREGYELTASDKVCINWYRLGLRDGERAHGIKGEQHGTE